MNFMSYRGWAITRQTSAFELKAIAGLSEPIYLEAEIRHEEPCLWLGPKDPGLWDTSVYGNRGA